MPVNISKTNIGYKVKTPGGIKAKHTTKEKAKSQQRLLNALEHNPNFTPYTEANGSMRKRKRK